MICHDAGEGTTVDYTSESFRVGSWYKPNSYRISRGFLPFDTSYLPNDANVQTIVVILLVLVVVALLLYSIVMADKSEKKPPNKHILQKRTVKKASAKTKRKKGKKRK